MSKAGLIFPHQLFEQSPLLSSCNNVYLVEEYLFFKQYNFHRQKIAFHRASMKFYEHYLWGRKATVNYIDSQNLYSDVRMLIPHLQGLGITDIVYVDTTDNWLELRLAKAANQCGVRLIKLPTPLFLNSSADLATYFADKKRMFQTDFYKHQRLKRNIMLDANLKPLGGKWTFDDENRLKYPKGKTPPNLFFPTENSFRIEALNYVAHNFPANYGHLSSSFVYPTTFADSKQWLADFLNNRFKEFGVYEDAIVAREQVLHHSLLTPMLNVGLLTPQYIVEETLRFAEKQTIPLNSVEGFIRQVIGWREFIRAVYELKGTEERTKNYWNFTRKIPSTFWTGNTGIAPVDLIIQKVLDTGYCHHIERLMVLGNFMLLCEFDPDEVYRWFMELFIDSYDWVMVPNVYGMSQFADGGLMATKPYISGSNYLIKMSDFKKGDWQPIWDGLFWRFMHTHRDFFLQNPRLGMLINTFDKMPEEKRKAHLRIAENYISSITL